MKKLKYLLFIVLVLGLITACGNKVEKPTEDNKTEVANDKAPEEKVEDKEDKKEEEKKGETDESVVRVVDIFGREIILDKTPEKVICIGASSLRMYTYVMGSDKIIGVDDMEKDAFNRPYSIAHPEYSQLPIIGPGGPKAEPDTENLSFAQPDVIFSTFAKTSEEVVELQKKIGIPVIAISPGRESTFDPKMYQSLEIIGKVMNNEKRSTELVEYMKGLEADLQKRSGSVEDSPGCYIGCISFRGHHDLLWTRTNFNLFNAVNAKNVVDGLSEERNITLDKEKLLELNPELIVVDLAGEELLKDDYNKDPDFYKSLDAFKNDNVFAIIPYHSYETNIDTAMVDMYYIGSIVHPDGFKDINMAEKAAEIYTKLLGKDVYQELLDKYPGGHKPYKLY